MPATGLTWPAGGDAMNWERPTTWFCYRALCRFPFYERSAHGRTTAGTRRGDPGLYRRLSPFGNDAFGFAVRPAQPVRRDARDTLLLPVLPVIAAREEQLSRFHARDALRREPVHAR